MRALLDTHVFLWAAAGSDRLSERASEILSDGSTELLLSAASAYEVGVKAEKGHLTLPDDAAAFLRTRMATFGIRELAVTVEHAVAAATLPAIHADPWDRLIIAQARAEAIPILTADRTFGRYDVEIIW